jgi:Spy/CpxP family protein refolding chaperone
MKKLTTFVLAMLLAASLSFAQAPSDSAKTGKSDAPATAHKGTKKGHKGGKKGKKSSNSTNTGSTTPK